MANVQVQFHADPREVVEFALAAATRRWSGDILACDRVALCSAAPDLTATSAHEFVGRNPDCPFLSTEKATEDGLRESTVAGSTDDAETCEYGGSWFGR